MSAIPVRPTAVAVCLLLLWCSLGLAQEGVSPSQPEGGDPSVSGSPQPAARPVVESALEVYYLYDEDGVLRAVPNVDLVELETARRIMQGLNPEGQRPAFVLEELSADGAARDRYAELTVDAKVVSTREDEWVRVPLGFDRSLLREPAEHEGEGEGIVLFDDEGGGHIGWIRGPAGTEHRFRLKLSVPLTITGEETQVRLLAPRATKSDLKLRVPVSNAVAEVSRGSLLVTSSAIDDETTEFDVQGLGGGFWISWHEPSRRRIQQRTVLEVEADAFVQIDPQGARTEAVLTVESSGAPLSSFIVRLPPGASLLSGGAPGSSGYSVVPIEGARGGPPEVEIRLEEETSEPVEVYLVTTQPPVSRQLVPGQLPFPDQRGEWLELAGFAVRDAAQQWGHIDLAAAGEWQVLWRGSGVRQVEPWAFAEEVVAGFDYSAQPYSLTVRLVPRRTRISVVPEYRLLVGARRVQLEASLQYTIRGAKAFSLDVSFPGDWESVAVEPEDFIAVDGITIENDVLSMPLLRPSTGTRELQVRAEWKIPEGSNSLAIPLPQPLADWPGSATVIVLPADNVELTPNADLMAGLVRRPGDPPPNLPYRQQPPLYYQAETPGAVFAADFRVRTQRIAADVTSRLSLNQRGGQVSQTLAYTIDYEPAGSLTVWVPRSLAESGQLEFLYDGRPLVPTAPNAEEVGEDPSGPVRLQVGLPGGCIGACNLEVQYSFHLDELVPEVTQLAQHEPVVLPLPLVMPEQDSLSSNKLIVSSPPDIKVGLSDEVPTVWERDVQEPGSPPGLQLSTDQPATEVGLEVELQQQGTTLVERAWVQTYLISSGRRDRALFSFTSDQKQLTLVVPPGADRVQVLLDREQLACQIDDQRRVTIPLSDDLSEGRHLLDVRTLFTQAQRHAARSPIELPRLDSDAQVDWSYWQLILPPDEHLIATPKGLTGEFTWEWDGCCWGRQPLLDQSRLADWVGLDPPADGPAERPTLAGVNCYLFSSMGNLQRSELWIAERSWIVLIASGVALLVGLLLIYVRPIRHPATLLVTAIALLSVGMLHPEPALLLAQAAGLGLGLALVAGLLRRGVAWGRPAQPLLESPSEVLESASTETHYPVPPAVAQASTQAIPANVPLPPPDQNE